MNADVQTERPSCRLRRFVRDDAGQDLVEYALLLALIGFVAVAAVPALEAAIATAYAAWDTGTQDLWVPPDPGAP